MITPFGMVGKDGVRRLVVDMATRMECCHDPTDSDLEQVMMTTIFFPLLDTLSPQLIIAM